MTPENVGLVGGIAGAVIGVIGGLIGTYFSLKNARTPAERQLMLRVASVEWLAIAVIFALLFSNALPQPGFWILLTAFFIGNALLLRWVNRRLAEIRAK